MNVRSLLAGLLLIGLSGTAEAQNQADFRGTWVMDATRSESAHQDTPTNPLIITITASGDDMTLETAHQENSRKTVDESIHVKLDGSETTSVAANGITVKAKAHWDGTSLVVETARVIQEAMVTTHYTYVLASGGHELDVDKTLSVQHGYQGIRDQSSEGHGKDVFVRATP